MSKKRPLGITALVILEIFSSMFLLFGGVGLILLNNFNEYQIPNIPELQYLMEYGLLQIIGYVLVIISLCSLIISWGLWTGRKWAWTLSFIFAILGGLSGLMSLPEGIGSLILNVFIIWYLMRPHVRSFYDFGLRQLTNPLSSQSRTSSSLPQLDVIYCTKCGAKNSIDDNFCRICGNALKNENDS